MKATSGSSIACKDIPTRRSSRPVAGQSRRVLQDASARTNTASSLAKPLPKQVRAKENTKPIEKFDRLGDPKDELDAYEYDLEIYKYLRKAESEALPSPAMFEGQSTITPRMRATVIDWLVDVHRKGKMHSETLYLTVNLIDQFLTSTDLDKSKLQRLGCAALLVAAKNFELYPPSIRDLVKVADRSFSTTALSRMESVLLAVVGFRVDRVVPSMFLKRFLRLCDPDAKLMMLAHFICETSIIDAEFIGMLPSKLSAAIVLLALTLLRGPGQWTKYMQDNTGYTIADLSPVVQTLLQSVNTASTGRFQAIRKKYATTPMYKVSAIPFPETIDLQ